MIQADTAIEPGTTIVLKTRPAVDLSEDEFFELCQANRDLRFERTAEGDVIITGPAGSESGRRNLGLGAQLYLWTREDGRGVSFDSSTGFALPNGAVRSPDAAWIPRERYGRLDAAKRQRFAPICPDFVADLRSPTDRLAMLEAKMREYLENGARLGWLIDPITRQVHVYRPGRTPEVLVAPERVSGDPVVPGFVLELDEIWDPVV